MTALHYIAIHSVPEMAEVLMICGANKSLRSKLNKLPAEDAKAVNKGEMAMAIMQFKPSKEEREERMTFMEHQYGLPITVAPKMKLPTAQDLEQQFSTNADFLNR